MTIFFQKHTFKKLIKSIEHLKSQDDLDRKENPSRVPMEWDSSIKELIRISCREDHKRYTEDFANNFIEEMLVEKGLLVKSPYGGHMFPLPAGVTLPSKEEFVAMIHAKLDILGAFGQVY